TIGLLRRARDLELARATTLIIPSEALRELAIGWGVPPEKVVVIPNPVSPPPLEDRETLRARHGLEGRTLVFAGRLVPQKSIDAGGVTEILRDEENGLLVPMNDAGALAAAIRRYFDDPALEERLRAAAPGSVERFAPDAIFSTLESLLEEAASGRAS